MPTQYAGRTAVSAWIRRMSTAVWPTNKSFGDDLMGYLAGKLLRDSSKG